MKNRKPSPRKRSSPSQKKTPLRASRARPAALHPLDNLSPYFDSPIDLLCIGDIEGNILRLNPQWEVTFGYPVSELTGKNFVNFVHPEDRQATLASFGEAIQNREVQNFVNRIRCNDGSYRWLEWRVVLRGKLLYTAARDITDRKQAEDALRESRQMLETILDTIPVRVFWKDLHSMYLGCNRPFVRDSGFSSPAEIIGQDDYKMGWVEQADLYRADDRMVMDTGKEKIGYEEPQTQADGKHIWLRTSKVPLRDLDGSIRGVLGTYEDITEQKAAEKALRESEERYHRIIRTITDYIYHVRVENGKAMETFHGRRCLSVTGYSAEELAKDADLWIRMVDPEDRPLVEEQARHVLSGLETPTIEHRLWRKDGIRRWVRNTPVLLRDGQGRLISYDGLIQDITERKEAELQIRAQHDLALALNATTNMQDGLRLCLETALRISGMDGGGIYLRDKNTGALDLIVHQGLASELIDANRHFPPDAPQAQLVTDGKTVYSDHEHVKELIGSQPSFESIQSLLAIPIRSEKQIIGSLNLASMSSPIIPKPLQESLETLVAQFSNSIARFRVETELGESEERYRQLFDLGSDAILFMENETGRILEANTAATALYGYTREEMLNMKNIDLSAEPEETRRVNQSTPAVPETVITIPLRLHRQKDGTVFPVEVTARFFIWQGKPVHIAAIRDISQRRKTENELLESRQMLETVLNTIPVRVFWKDRDLKYLGCNRAFAQDAGFSAPAEMIGLDDYHMVWTEQAHLYCADDRRVIESGQPKLNYEELQTTNKGIRNWVRTSKVPLQDPEGEIRGVLGTYEDITEYKKVEEEIRSLNAELEQRVTLRTAQLEATNKELEAFSFSVSHDLRAPLRAIDGFTRVLEEDYGKILDEEGKRLCSIIRRNTRHMYDLIDDLLALSRLSRAEMRHMPIDMNSMVQSIYQELTTPVSRARIDFQLGAFPKVVADPILLRQVWTNLIANAIKFSANKERARIEVECRSSPDEDVFTIRDNGAGFDMRNADRLFGVFQRLHNSSEFEGTGVGLAIVQRIVHRHGGRVWAEGEVDKGAVFHFALPKIQTEDGGPVAAS